MGNEHSNYNKENKTDNLDRAKSSKGIIQIDGIEKENVVKPLLERIGTRRHTVEMGNTDPIANLVKTKYYTRESFKRNTTQEVIPSMIKMNSTPIEINNNINFMNLVSPPKSSSEKTTISTTPFSKTSEHIITPTKEKIKQTTVRHNSSQKFLKRLSHDNIDSDFLKYYEVLKLLGEGRHGQVFEVKDKSTEEIYALKVYKKMTKLYKEYDEVEEEVNILNQLDHQNIIKIIDFISAKENIYVLLELARGGSLSQYVLPTNLLSERNCSTIMKQLFSAVQYMHSCNVVNRDLKTKNLLLKTTKLGDYSIWLTGFESAMILGYSEHCNTNHGVIEYQAHEILSKKEYTKKSDVFSCGVIMYELLSGSLPFKMNFNKVSGEFERIEEFNFEKRSWDTISDAAKNLIKRLIEKNPDRRITAEEAFNDPWFSKFEK